MKPSDLSAMLASRVIDAWGSTIVETLATLRVRAMDEEGPTDVGSNGWTPVAVEIMCTVGTLSGSMVVPTLGDGGIEIILETTRGD